MSNSVQPQRRQPTRLLRPWDSPGKNTGVGCHFLFQCMKVKSESEATQLCPTLSDPMDCSPPGSSVQGFSRQEYWSGVPLPSLYAYSGTLSSFSRAIYSEPCSVGCLIDTKTPTMWKKLTTWWPNWSHDISCHNSKKWPWRKGNKPTVELKINCT